MTESMAQDVPHNCGLYGGESYGDGELVFAYYVTGHGFGHATRVVEVARHLCAAGHEVYIVTGAPEFVFKRDIPSSRLHIRKVLLDSGAVQSDALTVDCQASLEQYYRTAVENREVLLALEVDWLKSIRANLVVSDIVPIACRAAARAGVPSICVSNFSWDFIYSEYVTVAGKHHQSIVWQIAEDYSNALFLIRLPGYSPMPAFRDVIDVPLVVRTARRSRQQVRKDLGVDEVVKVLLLNFGGQDARWSLKNENLPPGWLCWVCGAPAEQELGNKFMRMDRDSYVPDLLAASDCMLGKIGYGTFSEALSCKKAFIFVRRDHFNEEPFLRKMLELNRGGVEMNRRDFLSGRWGPYLERALVIKPTYAGSLDGGKVAATLLKNAARGEAYTIKPDLQQSGARRLRDAIIFGFQLQAHPGRVDDIPDWYVPSRTRLDLLPEVKTNDIEVLKQQNGPLTREIQVDDFDILEGDLHGLADTALFLRTLARLDEEGDVRASDLAEKPQERERLAAGGLFRWEDDVVVARAPGRLDVMGGIADYSGSLVLQADANQGGMPCRLAEEPTWEAKVVETHYGAACSKRVSFGSDKVNRAPTFDMDISDFFDSSDEPITYEAAHKYFEHDASQKWAAYVAGTILVLMREIGVRFNDSMSILISSAVPEGKGVSSSAALEVATMSAIAAAYGLNISPRELAVLCQKVENHIVGTPCGVMDQMASACGEANKLLAMVCQQAEVQEHVNIPSHVQFWGIDSGIRHSVGGADYGSVRLGAFMGRRIIQAKASNILDRLQVSGTNGDADDADLHSLMQDAEEKYLCNIPPHRLEAHYTSSLPETMRGEEFTKVYGNHNDPFTKIIPSKSYTIQVPAAHPIYENFRVKSFAVLLTAAATDAQLEALGELMFQSHHSYSKCGLDSHGTNRLVALVRRMKQKAKPDTATLFGAKITGGGCGGTVCVIGRPGIESSSNIYEIQNSYKASTGHRPYVFEGSSMGAGKFKFLRVHRRSAST
ncbi:L-arabinokinase isoform X3 [Physcomitrium patens]|uniref:L-arabinokinase isoform X3 n=1 Tax=Physcomitrium patens TaxID=3218 RepID=UPI000D170448|nr:L-arabinokinase-like isoform X3 [Physcomitrium patens]|eukprot:XP_024399655.1 L-arabinokinase-like isoform X3 [Physcomitrella patens]